MTRRGFILGKFMPPHAGHVWLCQAAAQLVDELTVLVCSLDSEPIAGHLRYDWMTSLLPEARIIHYSQDVPQTPDEHTEFWEIWTGICREVHPEPIDYVFGSDPYINRLAMQVSAEPVILDPDRLTVPISGTRIRENPAGNWDFIPAPVRPYFQKRIVMFGPESVGKTTLARELAQYFETVFVPEYGRTYTEILKPENWQRADFIKIARRHEAMRKALAPLGGPILLEDTDPLLTCVWEDMLTGQPADWAGEVELADLYLMLDTDVAWVDDGTRYFSQTRQQQAFRRKCMEILGRVGASFVQISGDYDQRRSGAIDAVMQFIGSGDEN